MVTGYSDIVSGALTSFSVVFSNNFLKIKYSNNSINDQDMFLKNQASNSVNKIILVHVVIMIADWRNNSIKNLILS